MGEMSGVILILTLFVECTLYLAHKWERSNELA